jgi:unsaturated chondroitin disaccharide hydrolase
MAMGTILGHQISRRWPSPDPRAHISLDQRIDLCLTLAKDKLATTIEMLDHFAAPGRLYPGHTKPNGIWTIERADFWSAGAFPALLWKIALLEADPFDRGVWMAAAKKWSDPLRVGNLAHKDITLNNLFVFAPWYETSEGSEKQETLTVILEAARFLARPFNDGEGSYHPDIRAFGWVRRADRTDRQEHWHVFMDHTINVEQLLWASQHTPNSQEAADWQEKAIAHLRTLNHTFGVNRRPGTRGTWQRGYFDHNVKSSNYRNFLFNEGKQGWRDNSTWSRGQAWFIYSACAAYLYSLDPQVLSIAKQAINYYLENLPDRFPGNQRRENDFVPPWDFDYALQKNPDTERDSSAAALAVAGMIRLVKVLPPSDPDYLSYRQAIENTLLNLTSFDYFPDETAQDMSLLRHGCYHHPEAIVPSQIYNAGLIWGDYFLIEALMEYRSMGVSSGGEGERGR